MNQHSPLRDNLKEAIEEDQLSNTELTILRASIDRHTGVPSKEHKPWLAAALAACMFLLAVFFTVQNVTRTSNQGSLASEVLTNHHNLQSLDLQTDSIDRIQSSFTKLDFIPVISSFFDDKKFHMLGGRYVTLKGEVALQISFTDNLGQRASYYQALYQKDIFGRLPSIVHGDKPKTLSVGNAEITLWRENGIVNVLAKNVK